MLKNVKPGTKGGVKLALIAVLIFLPFIAALALAFMRKSGPIRKYTLFLFCAVIIIAALYFSADNLLAGENRSYLFDTAIIDKIMLVAEWALAGLIIYYGFRFRKYYVALLTVVQTGLITWLELTGRTEIHANHFFVDRLTVIMCLIVGIVGCLICVYAMGYMKDYSSHHKEFKDRRSFFFSMLFVFLGAMFGLVLSDNLLWIYFFWEITSVCSFLLIGYNQTDEAIHNSFRALWMNLLGGLAFAIAIAYSFSVLHISRLSELVDLASVSGEAFIIPIILLAFAGLTKSAQFPFSTWLLGAMVAPTPTSALLHSATMVKAGVYLLLRIAPALSGNLAGVMVSTIGGFTFFSASMLAISQDDSKKILAYSTISNLGLITACAGVGMYEAVWAGLLLMIFHAVSKSLMFLSVGATENVIGSRNVEDMHGMVVKLPGLAFVMIVGIAGMFLAPFGMLISKWAALKAFVDSKSILLIVFLIFGSATTLFYWTKWLGTVMAVLHNSERLENTTKKSEWLSLIVHAVIMILLCISFPLVSEYLIEPFLGDMFNHSLEAIISKGNLHIMTFMLCAIVVLPIAVWGLTFKKNKVVISYMSGVNTGDDRNFIDSLGQEKKMYLANWYLNDLFGEKRLLAPSMIFSGAWLTILMIVVIGGAI